MYNERGPLCGQQQLHQLFDIDLRSEFQQIARVMKLCQKPIILTFWKVHFVPCMLECCYDVKKFVMMLKYVMMSTIRHDVKQYVIMSKICHDVKKLTRATKSGPWRQKVHYDGHTDIQRAQYNSFETQLIQLLIEKLMLDGQGQTNWH